MTTEINYDTAYEWLENHYTDVPDIWERFDQSTACEYLADTAEDRNLTSYDDIPAPDLMRIMEDSRM
nr:MAG TPA: hypothetical protein [Caudoviricetes sp.]